MDVDESVIVGAAAEPVGSPRVLNLLRTRRVAAAGPFLLLVPAVVLLVQSTIRMFRYTKTGLDLSDEGLYLLAATRRYKTDNILGAWGNFTHVILVLSGNSVAVFRFVGFMLLMGAGAAVGAALVYALREPLGSTES